MAPQAIVLMEVVHFCELLLAHQWDCTNYAS